MIRFSNVLLASVIIALCLSACGGGSSSGGATSVAPPPPPPPPPPMSVDPNFGDVSGRKMYFSDDESRYVISLRGGGISVYDNDGTGSTLLQTFSSGQTAELQGISNDGRYVFYQSTTDLVDQSKYTLNAIASFSQPTVSYVGDVSTGELFPMDIFSGNEVIAGRSNPIAMDSERGEVYFWSRNITQTDADQPNGDPTTIYVYSLTDSRVVREADTQTLCNTFGVGDYSEAKDRLLVPCGNRVMEIDPSANIVQIDNQTGARAFSAVYAENSNSAVIQVISPMAAGFKIDIASGALTQLTPTPCDQCELFNVSDDLRFGIVYTPDALLGSDVDGGSFDSYICEIGTGVTGCILLDADLPETDFSLAKYLSLDGTFLIGRETRQDNPHL